MCNLSQAASVLGRKGGLARSERKAKAVRENGRRGGRPRSYKPEAGPGFGEGRHYRGCACWQGKPCTCATIRQQAESSMVTQPQPQQEKGGE